MNIYIHNYGWPVPPRPSWRHRHRWGLIAAGLVLAVILGPKVTTLAALVGVFCWLIYKANERAQASRLRQAEAEVAAKVHADELARRCVEQDRLLRDGDVLGGVHGLFPPA